MILFKDGKSCTCDKSQIELMMKAGWSKSEVVEEKEIENENENEQDENTSSKNELEDENENDPSENDSTDKKGFVLLSDDEFKALSKAKKAAYIQARDSQTV